MRKPVQPFTDRILAQYMLDQNPAPAGNGSGDGTWVLWVLGLLSVIGALAAIGGAR